MVTIILATVVAVFLFSLLIRWWTHLESNSLDAVLLRKLRRDGADLSAPHDFEFYLGFPEELFARRALENLKTQGFEAELVEADQGRPWVVVVRRNFIPDESVLGSIISRLCELAESHKGEYGGWYTEPVPCPKIAAAKVGVVIATLVLLGQAIAFTEHEGWLTAWFIGFIYFATPLLIVTAADFAHACRMNPNNPRFLTIIGFVLGIPQALFAIFTIMIGVMIAGWVLYNTFVERQPEYKGSFLTFGMAPVMLLVGITWLRSVFLRKYREAAAVDKKTD